MGRKEYDELDDDAKKIVDKMVGHPVNDNKEEEEEEEEDADLKPAAVPSIPTSTHHIHHDQAEFPLYTGGAIFGAFVAFGAFEPFTSRRRSVLRPKFS